MKISSTIRSVLAMATGLVAMGCGGGGGGDGGGGLPPTQPAAPQAEQVCEVVAQSTMVRNWNWIDSRGPALTLRQVSVWLDGTRIATGECLAGISPCEFIQVQQDPYNPSLLAPGKYTLQVRIDRQEGASNRYIFVKSWHATCPNGTVYGKAGMEKIKIVKTGESVQWTIEFGQ